jgi:hypothetical protein
VYTKPLTDPHKVLADRHLSIKAAFSRCLWSRSRRRGRLRPRDRVRMEVPDDQEAIGVRHGGSDAQIAHPDLTRHADELRMTFTPRWRATVAAETTTERGAQ